jgi:DNA primase
MHNSVKQSVLQATDIVDVIGEHVSLTRKGKDYVGLCPFHPDHKPSMYVSPKKQLFKCFACGAGGDVLKFIQMRDRVDFRDALALLARRAGISLSATEADRRADQARDQIRQALVWARSRFQRNLRETSGGKAALEYALGRGLTHATIEQHGLGYAPDSWDDLLQAATRVGLSPLVLEQSGLIATSEQGRTYDRFRNRLIFPIADASGRPVAFGGRTLGDDPAKYLNSPETSLFSKSRILFGLDLARQSIEKHGEAIIVEGYLDAVLLHQFGFTHAVATLGTALTDAHVKLLKRLTDRLALCFDGDQAGVKAADRALEVAIGGAVDVRVVVLDAGMDPADCVLARGAAGFENALKTAVDALEFKWSQTLKAPGDGRPYARRAATAALIEFVAGVIAAGGTDPLEQGLLVRRLSELLALPADAVYEMLAAARKRARSAVAPRKATPAETSSYVDSVRGLPAGLVVAVEDLLGLLLTDGSLVEHVDDRVVQAFGACEVWRRLYTVMQNLIGERGGFTRAEAIERCDEAEVCELVSRACARAAGAAVTKETFLATRERLASELGMQRRGELEQNLRRGPAEGDRGDQAFGKLLEAARGEHFVLPAQSRWNATIGPSQGT